jgi:hypothetical protein
LSFHPSTALPDGLQILDDSTIDAHVFPVPANPSSSSTTPKKIEAEFHAGTRLETVIQDKVSGAGLNTEHEGNSLVQTFPGAGTDSHVDAAGALSGAGAGSQIASAASSPGASLVRMRESVRSGHVSGGDCL